MSDKKSEFPRDLCWVYLNNQLLEMPEDKRRKALEKIVSTPDPEYSLAALVSISDVPEDLARRALENIFKLEKVSSDSVYGCGTALYALINKFLSVIPDYLKEDFCKMCLDSKEVDYYYLSSVYKKMLDLSEMSKRKLLEKMLGLLVAEQNHNYTTGRLMEYLNLKNLPDDLKEKAMERLVQENPLIFLIVVNNPPEELKKQATKLTRQRWPADKLEIMRIIDSILPEWIVGDNSSPAFQRIKNVPVFRPGPWEILDKTTHEKPEMILLLLKGERHRSNDNVAVLLLRDISHDNLGYALQVPPGIKKVKEAHAYTCRQDPKTFSGFEREV